MLDLQVWVQPMEAHPDESNMPVHMGLMGGHQPPQREASGPVELTPGDPQLTQSLCWTFYEKPSASCRVLRSTLAYYWRAKLVTMNMEVFRRLRNTSRQLAPSSRAKILGEFVSKLRASGYLQSTVRGMIQSDVTYYYRKVRIYLKGGPALNIHSDKDLVSRRMAKSGAAKYWYARRRGGQETGPKAAEGPRVWDPTLDRTEDGTSAWRV